MFWGTEVKDVQAITTWDNILISRLICGIPLHTFLSKAAWRTNNQHGRRERQGRQRAQHRGQRRKEKRKQVPEGEKASRNGQDGQGVGEATGDVGEGPGVHVTHIQYTQTSLPWPLHLGWSHSYPFHTGKTPKSVYQTRNWSLRSSGLSLEFSALETKKPQALRENEIKRKIIIMWKKVLFPHHQEKSWYTYFWKMVQLHMNSSLEQACGFHTFRASSITALSSESQIRTTALILAF